MLEPRAVFGRVHRSGVGDEEHAMRVAHAHRDRIAGQRQVQRVNRARQRHVPPVKLRRTHVDADQPIGAAPGCQRAMRGHQRDLIAAKFGHDAIRDAAGGVAAGFRTRAVGVPEIKGEVRVIGVPDLGQLVEPDATMPVAQRARQCGRGHRPSAPRVDDHEVIAGAVHFYEGETAVICRVFHDRAYTRCAWILPVAAVFCP